MNSDRNFDDIAEKFAKNIYGTEKGTIREAVLWRDLNIALERLPKRKLLILDAGGGLSQLGQKLAKLGHHIILCDISTKMLDKAASCIKDAGLSANYTFINCPVQEIGEHIDSKLDMIMLHAVVEWLENPQEVVNYLTSLLVANGIFSLMFYNYTGLEFKNLICGNIPHVINGMPYKKRFKLQPRKAFKLDEVKSWLNKSSMEIIESSGVRCIHDYMGGRRLGEFDFSQLLEMELKLCKQEPYLSLGRYVHVLSHNR